jgi:hypothetical protein
MEQRTAAAPRSLSLVMAPKTPSFGADIGSHFTDTIKLHFKTGVCPTQYVIGQASVVGVAAPIHQKAMPVSVLIVRAA